MKYRVRRQQVAYIVLLCTIDKYDNSNQSAKTSLTSQRRERPQDELQTTSLLQHVEVLNICHDRRKISKTYFL